MFRRHLGLIVRCRACNEGIERDQPLFRVERVDANQAMGNGRIVAYVCGVCGEGFSGPVYGEQKGSREWSSYADAGGASRFFYTAKTSRAEREFGLDDLEPTRRSDAETRDSDAPGSNNPRLRVEELSS